MVNISPPLHQQNQQPSTIGSGNTSSSTRYGGGGGHYCETRSTTPNTNHQEQWSEEEALVAFEGHYTTITTTKKTSNMLCSKEDILKQLRPWWKSTPSWRAHHQKLKVGDMAPDSQVVTLLLVKQEPSWSEEEDDDDNQDVLQQEEGGGQQNSTKMTTVLSQKETTNLHSLLEKDPRPTVLVFGSMTCPSFRSLFLKEIVEIVQEQNNAVRLLVVYLAEAYPKDGDWHLHHHNHHVDENHAAGQQHHGNNDHEDDLAVVVNDDADIYTHKTIEERISAAAQLVHKQLVLYDAGHDDQQQKENDNNDNADESPSLVVAVDTMDDDTDKQYDAQPSRVYVIHQKKIVYQSEVGGAFRLSPSSLQAFLWEWQVLQQQQPQQNL